MNKDVLKYILQKLEELYEGLYLAHRIKDQRKRPKAIREAEENIRQYADFIPLEVKAEFDQKIGANALYGQHTDDISECIHIVKEMLKQYD